MLFLEQSLNGIQRRIAKTLIETLKSITKKRKRFKQKDRKRIIEDQKRQGKVKTNEII